MTALLSCCTVEGVPRGPLTTQDQAPHAALAFVVVRSLLSDDVVEAEERRDVTEELIYYALHGDAGSELILDGLDYTQIQFLADEVWDQLQDAPGLRVEMAAEDRDRD